MPSEGREERESVGRDDGDIPEPRGRRALAGRG